MSKDETAIEAEIQAKGLTAPRLTPALIDAQILSEHFIRASDVMIANTSDSERPKTGLP